MRSGIQDLIRAAAVLLQKTKEYTHDIWINNLALVESIHLVTKQFTITKTQLNRALSTKSFSTISDDSNINSLNIHCRTRNKEKHYYFPSSQNELPPSNS